MVSSICTTKLGVAALALFTGVALCLLALAFDAPPADATTFNVPCSGANDLIDAIEVANADGPNPDTIELAADCTYTLSSVYQAHFGLPTNYAYWYGSSGLPAIASDITVDGKGATIERSSAAGPPFRLLFVGADPLDPDTSGYASPGAGDLTLRDLTLRGGVAQGGDAIVGGGGGALYNLGYLAEDLNDPDGHTYTAHVVAAGSIITPAVVSAAPAMVSDGLQNTVDDPGDTTIDLTASNLIGAATEIGDGAVLRAQTPSRAIRCLACSPRTAASHRLTPSVPPAPP
jgi:hypothetical protein